MHKGGGALNEAFHLCAFNLGFLGSSREGSVTAKENCDIKSHFRTSVLLVSLDFPSFF